MQPVQPQLLNIFINIFVRSCVWSFLLFANGCGVDAGNPDSSPKPKNGVINFLITDAPIDEVDQLLVYAQSLDFTAGSDYSIELNDSEDQSFDLLSYQNGETLALTENLSVVPGTIEEFRLTLQDREEKIRAIVGGEPENSYNVAILDANGQLTDHLVFKGKQTVDSQSESTLIVDIDLRKSLSSLDDSLRKELGLDTSYRYVLRQDHSFYNTDLVGSLEVSGLNPEQKLCLAPTDWSSDQIADCTKEDLRSAKANSDGQSIVLAVLTGSYSIWSFDEENNPSLIQGSVSIEAGERAKVSVDATK